MNTIRLQRMTVTRRGYTLLFAVITAALVLGVAVFILSVSKKQYALSVAARDSIYALYAADSAIECLSATTIATDTPVTVRCNNDSTNAGRTTTFSAVSSGLDPGLWPSPTNVYRTTQDVLVTLDGGTCAMVSITDGNYVDSGNTKHKTIIESRGYNLCDSAGPQVSSRTVERALRLTYR